LRASRGARGVGSVATRVEVHNTDAVQWLFDIKHEFAIMTLAVGTVGRVFMLNNLNARLPVYTKGRPAKNISATPRCFPRRTAPYYLALLPIAFRYLVLSPTALYYLPLPCTTSYFFVLSRTTPHRLVLPQTASYYSAATPSCVVLSRCYPELRCTIPLPPRNTLYYPADYFALPCNWLLLETPYHKYD
jgi:hypothetical protein